MRVSREVLALALLLGAPALAGAQERAVVSKEISVGRSEATLRLEFGDGGTLAISLTGGSVTVDGETLGPYTPGDALDAAWRTLLGEAVALEDGPLALRLREWSPPGTLEGEGLEMGRRLDQALEGALSAPAAPPPPDAPGVSLSIGGERDAALLRLFTGQDPARVAALAEILKELGTDIRLHVDEDVAVAAGETVSGSLVVVQGDVRLEGTVEGDVVVVDGTLELRDGSRVGGDVRLADAHLEREGGSIEGEVREVPAGLPAGSELREQLRDELRRELRRELAADRGGSAGFFNPLRRVFDGIGGLIENAVAILVLTLVSVGVLAFAPRNLDVVAEAARRAPGRAAMVGMAGTFLLIPVWVLGFVALLVSIVGIPVAIAWIPLFPLAAVAAGLLGYLAVARNVGEWLGESGYPYTSWISRDNPVTAVAGGLVALMAFFIAGNVLGIVPFFGFLEGLLAAVGVVASLAALQVGFGAVLLTRAGRRPDYAPRDFDEAWRNLDVDDELERSAAEARGGDHG